MLCFSTICGVMSMNPYYAGYATMTEGKLRVRQGGSRGLRAAVLIESAAAALLIGLVTGAAALVVAAVVTVPLLGLALARRHGRPLSEALLGAAQLTARRRRAAGPDAPPGVDPGPAPLVECAPALRTCTFAGPDRRPVGLIGDGTFLTSVLRVEADAPALRGQWPGRPLPVAVVGEALEVDDIRLESAQIVLHTQPAPALRLPRHSVAVTNYAPLQASTGTPAVRITWIALKLDPELCAEAVAARGGGVTGARKCVVRVADHLAGRLTGAGFRVAVLDEAELIAALATSACADPVVSAEAGRTEPRERRTEESAEDWRCDNRRHTTYGVRSWPSSGGRAAALPRLVARLTAVPALATTFSLTLARGDGPGVLLTAYLRVTARGTGELRATRRALEDAARSDGVGLVRLDLEQLPGVLATLPLGGTP
jgi:type VII secretion protein EccE